MKTTVISGLSSYVDKKNSVEARLGGKIEQSTLKQISGLCLKQKRPLSGNLKSLAKAMPKCFALCSIRNPIEPLILGDLPIATPLSLVCWLLLEAIFHTCLLLLIGHFDGLKVHLTTGRREGWVCLTLPM